MRDVEHPRFAEVVPDDVQTHRKIVLPEPARDRHRGQPGEVGGDRIDVVQVHLHRVRGLGADFEGDRGRGRPHDEVALLERRHEVVCDQPTDLLRLEVVGVVVAVREHVGPDEDAAPDFGAEAFGARAEIHVGEVTVFLRAMAVAHAVEARQVRRGLGRRDDVVRGHGEAARGQVDRNTFRAELLELRECRFDRLTHFGGESIAEVLLGRADTKTRQRSVQFAAVILDSALDRGRIALVEPRHHVQKQRKVLGALRDRSSLIEAGGESDHAVPRHQTVSRLQPRHTRERSGLADRSAGIGARGSGRHARGNRRRRPARGAAGHVRRTPGIFHRSVERSLARGSHRELVHVGLAENHRPRSVEAFDHVRVVRAHEVRKHFRAAGSAPALRNEDVLVRDRNPGQRLRVALRDTFVRRARLRKAFLGIDGDERVERTVQSRGAIEEELGQLCARDFLLRERGGQLIERGVEHGTQDSG